jgi:hypothetical protein
MSWLRALTLILTIGTIVLLSIALLSAPGHARDDGQWSSQPGYIRQWFQSLMQPDNPYISCCGEADAFESDTFTQNADGQYVAIVTDGKGVIPNGTRVVIPDAKIKWDKGNPTGHGIVFIGNQGQVYCYVTPGGV